MSIGRVAGGREGQEPRYGAGDLGQGYGARAAAKDLQPEAAQHVGGQRDARAGHLSDLHQPDPRGGMGQAAPRDGRNGRLGGLARLRPAAITRPAPIRAASATAIRPDTPVAPSTSTVSPGCSMARRVSASQAPTPGLIMAAAVSSSRPSGRVRPAAAR
jgi:hypothetical protein